MAKKDKPDDGDVVEIAPAALTLDNPMAVLADMVASAALGPSFEPEHGLACPRDGARRFEWRKKAWLDVKGEPYRIEDVWYCHDCHGEFHASQLKAV